MIWLANLIWGIIVAICFTSAGVQLVTALTKQARIWRFWVLILLGSVVLSVGHLVLK